MKIPALSYGVDGEMTHELDRFETDFRKAFETWAQAQRVFRYLPRNTAYYYENLPEERRQEINRAEVEVAKAFLAMAAVVERAMVEIPDKGAVLQVASMVFRKNRVFAVFLNEDYRDLLIAVQVLLETETETPSGVDSQSDQETQSIREETSRGTDNALHGFLGKIFPGVKAGDEIDELSSILPNLAARVRRGPPPTGQRFR